MALIKLSLLACAAVHLPGSVSMTYNGIEPLPQDWPTDGARPGRYAAGMVLTDCRPVYAPDGVDAWWVEWRVVGRVFVVMTKSGIKFGVPDVVVRVVP
jgi:hypothetical protein